MLLEKIKNLANKRNISPPSAISKEEGREDLSEETGKEFDKKFIKMMIIDHEMVIIDHERDVKLFKKVIDSNDPEVSAFTLEYLPMIQSHLDKQLDQNRSKAVISPKSLVKL